MINIRITRVLKHLEPKISNGDNGPLKEWIKLSITDLEYRLRYAGLEEAQVLQGALRVLYDIQSLL